jgi:hypothetical protein
MVRAPSSEIADFRGKLCAAVVDRAADDDEVIA